MERDSKYPWMLAAILTYGVCNAVLYAGLLPLWDGFDEPFHYGYVQQLSRHRSLPAAGTTVLSAEVWRSLALAPASHLVQHNLPHVTTFDRYFQLREEERRKLRRELDELDPQTAIIDSQSGNYEALQAPLAYLVLAPFDLLWAGLPLPERVLRLRWLCGIVSVIAAGLLTWKLGRQLRLPPLARLAAVFLLLSSQMLYATVAHVANDWLAVPLFILIVSSCISVCQAPKLGTVLIAGLALAAGLMTKAYFLALVPAVLVMIAILTIHRKLQWSHAATFVIACACAAPWYIRNLVLYGNLSAMQETRGGASTLEILKAGLRLPWLRSFLRTAETSIWTGNNSSGTFHSTTVRIMLLMLLTGVCLYMLHAIRSKVPIEERLVIAALASYAAALTYSTMVTFWATKGSGITTGPWYVQTMAAPGLSLVTLGLWRGWRIGRLIIAAMLALWTYVISATYLAKLIPLYGGYTRERATIPALLHWYGESFDMMWSNLRTISLLSPAALLILTAATVLSAIGIAIILSTRVISRRLK